MHPELFSIDVTGLSAEARKSSHIAPVLVAFENLRLAGAHVLARHDVLFKQLQEAEMQMRNFMTKSSFELLAKGAGLSGKVFFSCFSL